MTWKERFLLFLLAAVNFTSILDFMIMMPLGNFLMPHFSIGPRYFSAIVAAYPLTAFVSGVVAAFHVDRYDRKRVLLWSYAGFLVGTVACGVAPGAGFLMAARVATGLFGGLLGAQILSIVADCFPYEKRGRAMGAVFMAFAVSSVLGVPFSLQLAGRFSWHAPFLFIGLLGWLLVPLLARFLPPVTGHLEEAPTETGIGKVVADIWRNRSQRDALSLTGLLVFGHFLIIPFINPFMEFNKGLGRDQTPYIYMIGGICSMTASFAIGRLSDRFGKLPVFTIAVLCSLVPILLITHMPDWPFLWMLSIFGFWFAASTSRAIPAQAMVSTVAEGSARGRFMSFNSSFQQLCTGLSSLVSGMVVAKSPDGGILHFNQLGYLSAAVVAACLLLGRRLARRQGIR